MACQHSPGPHPSCHRYGLHQQTTCRVRSHLRAPAPPSGRVGLLAGFCVSYSEVRAQTPAPQHSPFRVASGSECTRRQHGVYTPGIKRGLPPQGSQPLDRGLPPCGCARLRRRPRGGGGLARRHPRRGVRRFVWAFKRDQDHTVLLAMRIEKDASDCPAIRGSGGCSIGECSQVYS